MAALVERIFHKTPYKFQSASIHPYTICKDMDDHNFKLNLPPFLNLHLVLNAKFLKPYFPPILDTLEIKKHLVTIDINP